MKKIGCLIAVVCCLFGYSVRADTLIAVPITFTGTVYRGGGVKPASLSKQNLLALFGSPTVKADTTSYFYDETTDSYVLASKNQITIYGSVFAEAQSGGISWDASATVVMTSRNCSGLNGNLTGTFRERDVIGKHSTSESVNFIISGAFASADTIINGAVTASFPH